MTDQAEQLPRIRRVKPGARYSTPEELVAAYRQNHGLE